MTEHEDPLLEGEMSASRVTHADRNLDRVVARAAFGNEENQAECPICRGRAWDTPSGDFRFGSGVGPTIYRGESEGEVEGWLLRVVIRVCNRCGFVRAHAAKRVEELAARASF